VVAGRGCSHWAPAVAGRGSLPGYSVWDRFAPQTSGTDVQSLPAHPHRLTLWHFARHPRLTWVPKRPPPLYINVTPDETIEVSSGAYATGGTSMVPPVVRLSVMG
jgi:hypothetical protein